jgi:glycosyltransferase involved in cell wall biosynthesis
MKVLHVTDHWNLGGLSHVVHHLGQWQMHHGLEVVIAVGDVDRNHALQHQHSLEVRPPLAETATPRGLLAAVKELRRLDRVLRPDVIHVHQRGLALAALLATSRSHRVVEHVHGIFDDHRLTSFRTQTTLVVGEGVRRMVVDDYGRSSNRVFTVINGVPDLGRRPHPSPEFLTVVAAGRLSEEKGVERFVGVAREMQRRGVPVRMAWKGWGPLEGVVRHEPTVAVVSASLDVASFLASAHIVLSPSWRDSMTLTIIEAMCVGRAVVATDVGSVDELVVDGVTGRLLPATATPRDFADAVVSLCDATLLRRMGDAARSRYEQGFTVEHMCRSVDRAYTLARLQ